MEEKSKYVITIGREIGSGGKAIGELMAKQLNIPIYDRSLIQMAAEESGISPKVFKKADEVPHKGTFSYLMRTLASPFASYGTLYRNSMSHESLFKFQSDIIQAPVIRPACVETTAMGAAFLAGLAVGFWQDLAEISRVWKLDATFSPVMSKTMCDEKLAGWAKAVSRAMDWA